MPATAVQLADGVVAELSAAPAGTFSLPFTAQRHFLPRFTLEEMAGLHVSVVPRGVTLATLSRTAGQDDYVIDVGVQQKLSSEMAEIEALLQLVEEIRGYCRGRRLATAPNLLCVKVENDPLYLPEHLEQLGQFTSVVSLTFR